MRRALFLTLVLSLIAAACRIGPLLVGAPAAMVEAMTRFGESLGLAF